MTRPSLVELRNYHSNINSANKKNEYTPVFLALLADAIVDAEEEAEYQAVHAAAWGFAFENLAHHVGEDTVTLTDLCELEATNARYEQIIKDISTALIVPDGTKYSELPLIVRCLIDQNTYANQDRDKAYAKLNAVTEDRDKALALLVKQTDRPTPPSRHYIKPYESNPDREYAPTAKLTEWEKTNGPYPNCPECSVRYGVTLVGGYPRFVCKTHGLCKTSPNGPYKGS